MAERIGEILNAKPGGHRVNGWVDSYTNWVIKQLVGTRGRNRTDVVSTIIREWMNDHREELEAMGVGPPRIRAGRVQIVPPGAG
jgi:hypothetical protein